MGPKPRTKACPWDRGANLRAAMRMNPKQASKVKMWTPTRLNNGEGRRWSGKQPTEAPDWVHRGNGGSTQGRFRTQRGRPVEMRGATLGIALGRWSKRESERPMVPERPVKAGGGTGPCFWVLPKPARERGLA